MNNQFKVTKDEIIGFENGDINLIDLDIIDEQLDYLNKKNIYKGNLWVKGDILSGIDIVIEGNLQVDGIVENVKIKCNGDVYIKGGFLGQHTGYISCNGNFYSKYIQNASVKANEVIIGDNISNSNIVAIGGITVKGKGKIIGGNCYAKDYVICKELGSPGIIETNVKIGYNFLKRRQLQLLKKKLTDLKLKIEENEKFFKKIFGNIDFNCFEIDIIMKNIENIKREKIKFLKLLKNIQLKEEFQKLEHALVQFDNKGITNLDSFLKTSVIYPGVNLAILDKDISITNKIVLDDLIIKRENIAKWQQY